LSLLSTLIPFVLWKLTTQTFKVHLRRRGLLFIAPNETLNIIRSENDSIGSSYHEISGRFPFTAAHTHTHTHTHRTLRSAFCASILTLSCTKFSFVYFRVFRYNKGPQCIPEYYYTKLLTEYTNDCCRTNVVNFHFALNIK
jgi:hypothetical protein